MQASLSLKRGLLLRIGTITPVRKNVLIWVLGTWKGWWGGTSGVSQTEPPRTCSKRRIWWSLPPLSVSFTPHANVPHHLARREGREEETGQGDGAERTERRGREREDRIERTGQRTRQGGRNRKDEMERTGQGGRKRENEKGKARKGGREDPYTLLAGYHLAWRLAIDGHDDSLNQACHPLSELQRPAEDTFGTAHMQTIAILTAQARVLHDPKHCKAAEKSTSEAVLGEIRNKWPFRIEKNDV
jgi:hypothetical protein